MLTTLQTLFRLVHPAHLARLVGFLVAIVIRRLTGFTPWESADIAFKGITLRLRTDFPSGLRFITEILEDKEYGAFPHKPFVDGDILFDVGANVGLVTLLKASHAPALRVYAFEPHPTTFRLLQDNLQLNQLGTRVQAENLAISDHVGVIRMIVSEKQNMAIAVQDADGPGQSAVDIPCLTLDAYCSQNGVWPTYLKIDVEGHETEVLRGAREVMQRAVEIIIETHSPTLHAECTALLLPHGFRLIDGKHLLHGRKPDSPAAAPDKPTNSQP